MIRIAKKIILGSLSILGISLLIWTVFLLNPSFSYANQTNFDHVTVYHNQDLDPSIEVVLTSAIDLIKKSELFNEDINIKLCVNDDKLFPRLNPFGGQSLAYAYFDIAVMNKGEFNFSENKIETRWAVNNNEYRRFDLTQLLAHEFTHNLQCDYDVKYWITSTLGSRNWKFEGHAEYITRGFKNDGKLREKIDRYLFESSQELTGLPVFKYEDGTSQILSYYKYALMVQYLMDEKKLSFKELCGLDTAFDTVYEEMLAWKEG